MEEFIILFVVILSMSEVQGNAVSDVRRIVRENYIEVLAVAVVFVFLLDLLNSLRVGSLSISTLLIFIWDGLVIGIALGLAGIGLSMTYSILGFANVAHGDTMTTGVFLGWGVVFVASGGGDVGFGERFLLGVSGDLFATDLGLSLLNSPLLILLGLVVTGVLSGLLAFGIDRLVFRPLRDADSLMVLTASVGVAFALRYLIVFFYTPTQRSLVVQPETLAIGRSNGGLALAGTRESLVSGDVIGRLPLPGVDGTGLLLQINAHQVLLVIVAVLVMIGIHLLLQRTKLGKSMRAMADNEQLARSRGIPTERVITWTWLIGGGATGIAGFLIVLERGTLNFQFGWLLLLLIFASVILGGIGSIYGAIAGGIIIGLMTTVSLVWLPEATLARPFAFVVMILVLLVKPQGIFGGRIVG
jgi:branched-chain amino acid transport system permease protein